LDYTPPSKLKTLTKKRIKKERAGDTIGGLLLLKSGNFSGLCTSSGGPWLKESGRVGSSALKAAGFDLDWITDSEIGLCLASGHGENIIERQLCG